MARVALVTGGTRGIGAAISLALKAQGRKVVANYASNDVAAEILLQGNRYRRRQIRCQQLRGLPGRHCQDRLRARSDRSFGQQRRHHPRCHDRQNAPRYVGCGNRYQPRLLLQYL